MKSFFVSILCAFVALAGVAAEDGASSVLCRVNLTSQPSGASVVVDGKDRGTTPILIYDLTPGRHHVKLRLAGYADADRFINTSDGPFIEKNTVLDELKGLLLLKTDPEGADIQVDGVSVGVTPRLVTNLSVRDAHTVRFRKAGYQDQTISVRFDGRKPLVREEKLVLASGTIDVMSEPAGAVVTVNGVERGKAPLKVTGVPKGRAVVKFQMDGFAEEVRELAINAGDVQTLPVVLKPLPGTLRIAATPDGARIYVNDRFEGKSSVSLTDLKPGDYAVRVEMDGYGTVSRVVTLANGGSASEEFKLSSVMGSLEVATSPAGAQVSVDCRKVGTTKAIDATSEFSAPLVVASLAAGEHRVVVSLPGYADAVKHVTVENQKASQQRVRLRRVFIPDIEVVLTNGNSYKGVLVSNGADSIVVEVSLGITRSFARSEIKKVNFIRRVEGVE